MTLIPPAVMPVTPISTVEALAMTLVERTTALVERAFVRAIP